MVGFGLALLGGAMKGWGQGQMEEIKQQRDEKLRLLDQQFQASENEKSRQVQREQIAATERSAAETRALQERLANIQEAGATARTGMTTSTQKEISQAQIGSEEKRTQAQIDAAKNLEQMRIDAQNALGVKIETTADGRTVMMRPDGTVMPTPNDPETGKPLKLATTSTDTDDMKNYKFMISVGVDPNEAKRLAFSSKNADPSLMYTSLVETFTKAQTTFGVADDQTAANADRWAKLIMNNAGVQLPSATTGTPAPAATPAPATGGGDATAPSMATQPTTAKILPLPAGMSRDQMIANAKAAVATKGRDAVVKVLQTYGISAAEAGL